MEDLDLGYITALFSTAIFLLTIGVYLLSLIREKIDDGKYMRMDFTKIDTLTGIEFEKLLKVYFTKMGYKVNLTKVTGDFRCRFSVKKRK